MEKLIIGSHQSIAGPSGLVGSVEKALADGANTFMIYLTAPQSTIRRNIDNFRIEEAKELMKKGGIDINHVVVHAPYIINLANNTSKDKEDFNISFTRSELERAATLGFRTLVIHPGSYGDRCCEEGIKAIASTLNAAIKLANNNVRIALETMAGKGKEIGTNLHELKQIIDLIDNKEKIGICLDTCHLHDSGIDLVEFDKYLAEFDALIGLKYLLAVHVNDSKNVRGSHKDRHENLGFGSIGFENLVHIVFHKQLENIPKILETPYVNDQPVYKQEIASLKNKTFDASIKS